MRAPPPVPAPLRLWLLALFCAPGCSPATAPRPNVLLITLDTTRVDHLGCYGHERDTSPNLDRLAAEGERYTRAYSVTSWTLPSHASIFTGKFPSAHGARHDPDGILRLSQGIGGELDAYRAHPIADDEETLAGILSRAGWSTLGVAGGPWMKRVFRLDRGFQHYDDDHIDDVNGRPADDVTRVARAFIDEHRTRPFFLFLNYFDPHGPYLPSPRSMASVKRPEDDPAEMDRFERARLAYDAEIHFMDEQIGVLFDHLRSEGLWENTWVIVLSDHGELMGDSHLGGGPRTGHGHSLSEAEIHIPLIVKRPGPSPPRGVFDQPVQQTDVLPTLLAGLGLPLPPDVQGRPLRDPERPPVFAEVYPLHTRQPLDWRGVGAWRVLFEDRHKFGWNSLERHFLVNLEEDPGELVNLAPTDPIRVRRLQRHMRRLIRSLPRPGTASEGAPVDPRTLQTLDALGYGGGQGGEENQDKATEWKE